jgi:hypothetical protein
MNAGDSRAADDGSTDTLVPAARARSSAERAAEREPSRTSE